MEIYIYTGTAFIRSSQALFFFKFWQIKTGDRGWLPINCTLLVDVVEAEDEGEEVPSWQLMHFLLMLVLWSKLLVGRRSCLLWLLLSICRLWKLRGWPVVAKEPFAVLLSSSESRSLEEQFLQVPSVEASEDIPSSSGSVGWSSSLDSEELFPLVAELDKSFPLTLVGSLC